MKILVIGDYISDVYTFGTATRLCPEAPVPVIVPEKERKSQGGAGLVTQQLEQLQSDVRHCYGSWSNKKRIFAGNHLICRLDEDNIKTISGFHVERAYKWWDDDDFEWADAIVISDYGKGAMTRELAQQIVGTGKPCFVDAKHHWHWYWNGVKNVRIFPNEHETNGIGRFANVTQKLGARGCKMGDLEIPATVSEVVDTTGAGDIFMASFVYAWSLQLQAEDCLRFANEMAGESCRHIGTYVVPREFAQGVLDRLRASREWRPLVPSSSPDSTLKVNWKRAAQALQGIEVTPRYPELFVPIGCDSPVEDWPLAQEDRSATPNIHADVQTLPQSPLGPTESSDTQPLVDRQIPGSPDSGLRSGPNSLSSTESGNQCERIPMRDRALHPGKS